MKRARVSILPWFAKLNKKSSEFVLVGGFTHRLCFGIKDADYGLVFYRENLSTVSFHQFTLMCQIITKLRFERQRCVHRFSLQTPNSEFK